MKMTKNEVKTKQGKIVCPSTELNLGITLKGGQSFRWSSHNDGYRGVFDDCIWSLTKDDTHLSYVVQSPLLDSRNYDQILSNYFRLDVRLEDLCKIWTAADHHLKESMIYHYCRISGMVEKLCTLFGEKICSIEDNDYYSFPSIKALAGENVENKLKEEKFGYRAGYIANTAKRLMELGGKEWLLNLHKKNSNSYAEARKELITLPGIGPKVADCICLMSLGYLEAIPVDTHIFQIARANYLPHLEQNKTVTPKIHEEISSHLRELWGPMAGWAQAIVFCAKIDNRSSVTSNHKRKTSTNKSRKSKNFKN